MVGLMGFGLFLSNLTGIRTRIILISCQHTHTHTDNQSRRFENPSGPLLVFFAVVAVMNNIWQSIDIRDTHQPSKQNEKSFISNTQPTNQATKNRLHTQRENGFACTATLSGHRQQPKKKKKNDRFVEHGEKSGLNMCVCSSPILWSRACE